MSEHFTELFYFFDLVAFLGAIFMHLVKKNSNLIRLYAIQSLAVAALLFVIGLTEGKQSLLWIGALTLVIKVIVAPLFFSRLMHRFGAQFTASNYLSVPLTLVVLTGLVMFTYSHVFLSLATLLPQSSETFLFAVAIIFISIFLMINRRGVFAQMVGILSLENGIVLFAALIGIDQPLALEIGIIFDIVIWMVIGGAFISMIHRQFGSFSTANIKTLT